MNTREVHQCQCEQCQQEGDTRKKLIHHQINVVMARLDEQQRRWYAAVEANRRGHGGVRQVSQITGMDEKTIRRGQQELAEDLESRPVDRVRRRGAGRPSSEKKSRR